MISHTLGGGGEWSRARSRRGRSEGDSSRPRRATELPHSIEAEESLIGCCLIDGVEGGDTLQQCREANITARSFYFPANGIVFGKLMELYDRQVPIDTSVLYQALETDGSLEKIGGSSGFAALTSCRVSTTAQATYFIQEVSRLARQRRKVLLAEEIASAARANDDERLVEAESEFRQLEAYGAATLPPVMTWKELSARQTPKPPELVAGVLHKGRRMVLAGGAKSFKSWVLLDLGDAVATGTPWWGMRTTQGKVLYVNFELPEWGLRERLADIARARQGLTKEQDPVLTDALEIWDLDGYGADIDELLPHFEARLMRGQYSLVILDPIYVCLGERDENSNGDVTQLMNRLAWLARRTGAAVAFGHHFSKGNQAEREAKDRASGAGAWVRAPDTVVTLTAHEEEGCYTASFVLRSQPQKNEVVVRWRHPCMEVAPGLDPAALKTAGRPKAASADDVVALLGPDDLLTDGEWQRRAADRKDMKESTYKRRKSEALASGKVEKTSAGLYRLKRSE